MKPKLSVTIHLNVPVDPTWTPWCVVCGAKSFAKGYIGWKGVKNATGAKVTSTDGKRPDTGGGPYFAHPHHPNSQVRKAAKREFLIALGET